MTGSNYKNDMDDIFDYIRSDVRTIMDELNVILEMEKIDDMKAALQDTISTTQTLLEAL